MVKGYDLPSTLTDQGIVFTEDTLKLARGTSATGPWTLLTGPVVDITNNTISFITKTGGFYTIVGGFHSPPAPTAIVMAHFIFPTKDFGLFQMIGVFILGGIVGFYMQSIELAYLISILLALIFI